MPFEPGNQLGTLPKKAKHITDALNRAIAQDNAAKIRAGVDKLLDAFANAEPWAVDQVWSRLEGKPVNAQATDDNGQPVFSGIQLIVVKADQLPAQNVNVIKDITHDAMP